MFQLTHKHAFARGFVQAKPFVSLRNAYRLKAMYKTMIVSYLKQKNHEKFQSRTDRSITDASKSDGGFVAINQFCLWLLVSCQSSLAFGGWLLAFGPLLLNI
jgi:hypothetical protein